MTLADEWLKGRIVGSESLVNKMYSCLQCGRCDLYCPLGIQIKDSIAGVRRLLTKNHFAPHVIEGMQSNYKKFDNPYSSPTKLPYHGVNLDKGGDVLFFKGCLASTHVVDEMVAAERLLDAMGVSFFELPQESCCGYIFEILGLFNEASTIYSKNVERILNSGAKEIITACPTCFKAFGEIYPRRFKDFDVQVHYITEILLDSMEEGRLSTLKRVNLKVSYQDPCGLRGQPRFAVQARDLLVKVPGLKFIESEREIDKGKCCGGGSASAILHPTINMVVGKNRMDDFIDINTDIVVSSCPLCILTLREASKGLSIAVDGLSKLIAFSSRSIPI